MQADSASIHSISLDTTSNPVPRLNFCVTWVNTGANIYFGYRLTDSSGNTPSNGYQGSQDNSASVTWCNGGATLSWNTSYTIRSWVSQTNQGESPVVATYSFSTGSAPTTTTTTAATTTTTAATTTTTVAGATTTTAATTTTTVAISGTAWSNAPQPNHSANALWAAVYQTPEESGYGHVTGFVCGSKSTYGLSGTTGGVNLGGGGRLGVRYIYFASSCYDTNGNGISTQCSSTCLNTSTFVFTIANGYTRYAGELVLPSATTTTTTTTTTVAATTTTVAATTTTVAASKATTTTIAASKSTPTTTTVPLTRPDAPTAPSVGLLTSTAVRVSWTDSGVKETGYIVQRSDVPVGTGISTAMWPYKTAANVTSLDFSGLSTSSQACFAVASFNTTGASKFSEWGCINLSNPGGAVTPPPAATLSCDGVVVKNLSTGASFKVTVGASNAGRLLAFEFYEKGKWAFLGQARVDASGAGTLNLKSVPISKVGSYPIRATQGSRFICEGDLSVTKKLKSYKK